MKNLISLTVALMLMQPVWADGVCYVQPYFSPTVSVEDAIYKELLTAKKSVKACLYGITNDRLVEALLALKAENVSVEVAVDRLQATVRGSDVERLRSAGIPVYVKKRHALNHHKFVVIDEEKVLMGSWNWSGSADSQDNSNVLLKGCDSVVEEFSDEFERIKQRDQ